VTAKPDLFILDTNILVHLIRDSPLGRSVTRHFDLLNPRSSQLISVITVGEILAFGKKRSWGPRKTAAIKDLVGELVVLPLDKEPILNNYAEIDTHLQKVGLHMEQNDMWIAATAAAARAHLLTTDRDFDPLHPHRLTRTWIDPAA
jgi:tRNA(fMet)-specific endonuclease VapC